MSTGKGENPVIILIIVLALAIFGVWTMKNNPAPVLNFDGTTNDSTNKTGTVAVDTSAREITYGEALAIYKNSRIQFDTLCQASPNNFVYKNGTNIMIDNRSPVSRSIKVGSVYNVEAYGFKIIQLSSIVLPTKWLVDCDNSQNVATITIQR
jgi:hypothetical protein